MERMGPHMRESIPLREPICAHTGDWKRDGAVRRADANARRKKEYRLELKDCGGLRAFMKESCGSLHSCVRVNKYAPATAINPSIAVTARPHLDHTIHHKLPRF